MILTKSETNNAVITRLQSVRKHPNADRLKLATVFGTTVIVGLDAKDGDLVAYFDSNLCLSPEYMRANNLYSNKDPNKDPTKGVTLVAVVGLGMWKIQSDEKERTKL